MINNSIYLRRRRKLALEPGAGQVEPGLLAALLKNLEPLGFTLSQPLMERAATLSIPQLAQLYEELIPTLRELVGANRPFKPMYPNFPAQVMEASDAELYINAILHYLLGVRPQYEQRQRPPLSDQVQLKPIALGTPEDFRQMFVLLLNAKTPLSPADREDLAWFVGALGAEIEPLLPASMPSKENLAALAGMLMQATPSAPAIISRYVKTATDVLRIATALSDGDVSLAENTRFRSFRRAERRMLLELLEGCDNSTEDMLRHKERWIRLGERLHPGEHKGRFPRAFAAFDVLRNDRPFMTFNSAVELALRERNISGAVALLRTRPGELTRRLDHLLRSGGDWRTILDSFAAHAERVATPVLLQTLAHFRHRPWRGPLRAIFPKGNVAKVQALENQLPRLDKQICDKVVAICRGALIERFHRLPPLGDVWVDERLRGYLVPFSQRSASKALRTIVRGSRVALPEGGTVRFFLWWKEGEVNGEPTGRVDIDLSAVMYDAEWTYKEDISYMNLRSHAYRACHSGDIVEAPNGACEFIDLDIDSVVQYGGRYVVMSLNSFTSQPFCNLPECYAGWMMRQEPDSGEIFEPSTVQDKIDLAANTSMCLPVIIDLVEREVIWTDIALTKNPLWYNNVRGNSVGISLMGRALTSLAKPTLFELFELHARARGQLVERDAASTIFSIDRGITPFDIDVIMAEYL